jgi:hypothetical protein
VKKAANSWEISDTALPEMPAGATGSGVSSLYSQPVDFKQTSLVLLECLRGFDYAVIPVKIVDTYPKASLRSLDPLLRSQWSA